MAAIILMMMAATFVEKLAGNEAAFKYFYHSPVFILLWAVAVVFGVVYLLQRKVTRHPATFSIHISFVVILVGALLTFLFSENGQLRLRLDEPNGDLPVELTLEDFSVERYSGSMAASDYRSVVQVTGGPEMDISMNHIGRYKGYRFYQASYDEDMKGSVLSYSHDPWGTGVTYTGYVLLLLSLILFFFQKDSGFRRALKRVAAASLALLLFVCNAGAKAKNYDTPPAIPKDIAEEFGELYVYYNDRIAPFQTLARDYCMKAYGKASFDGYTAEQVVTGWLFYYDWWRVVPFKLKAKDKGTDKEREKEDILLSAASGQAFKLFPLEFADSTLAANPGLQRVTWFSCDDLLPSDLDYDRWVFVRKTLDLIHDEVKDSDWTEVRHIISQIKKYQEKTAASVLPSEGKIKAERFYNRISRPMAPSMASLTLGIILFILSGIRISLRKRTPRKEVTALSVLSAVLFVYLALVLGLRWYVSGHAPFAGSYSVMLLIAMLTSLAMTLAGRKFPLVQPAGFILAGFTMLLASMASANPQITHLMPVLQSPLLSIHVLSMMLSYTIFGILALNGIMGLCVSFGKNSGEASIQLMDESLVLLYPALFLLVFGTFLGAVWANVSWGSYWSWDPKETWALVTILVYSLALHGESLPIFRKPRFFHLFCILALITVLITYFGVNLILGGMHSYA